MNKGRTMINAPSPHDRIIAAIAALQWVISAIHSTHRDSVMAGAGAKDKGLPPADNIVAIFKEMSEDSAAQLKTILAGLQPVLENAADWLNGRDAHSDFDHVINPLMELALGLGEFEEKK